MDNGEIYRESYQALIEKERGKPLNIPFLSIPHDKLGKMDSKVLASIYSKIDDRNKKKISEIIINEHDELTFIISSSNRVASAFLGEEKWSEKVSKLEKILNHFEDSGKLPSLVNLTNLKKVVVKF